jgi:hypothetical protein
MTGAGLGFGGGGAAGGMAGPATVGGVDCVAGGTAGVTDELPGVATGADATAVGSGLDSAFGSVLDSGFDP